jgi:CMP/dCMP kinase
MKRHIITLSGLLGSGKSSTGNRLGEVLGYQRFSAGHFQRTAAKSLGLAYDEYQKVAEQDPQYDQAADEALKAAGALENVVIDARLGYHFIPDSFKVFLTLPPEVAAGRILKDAETNPERHRETAIGMRDVESITRAVNERAESERIRYEKYYGLKDIFAPENFDLVVDTSKHPLEEVVQIIKTSYEQWLAQ